MKSLYKFHRNIQNANKRHRKIEEQIENEIKALQEKLKAHDAKYVHFVDKLKQLGKELLPKVKGAVKFVVYGPFGLGNECSIYFVNKNDKTVAGASFRHGSGEWLLIGNKSTNRYKEGSIGEMNGFNRDAMKITPKMTTQWFLNFMKRSK